VKSYKVYKHPVNGYKAVKQGFSWPGFFLGFIWAFYQRLWLIGTVLLIVTIVSYPYDVYPLGLTVVLELFQIGMGIYVGKNGNLWREHNLKDRGYRYLRKATAKTDDGAIGAIAEIDALEGRA
jgi:hypothetical protein